MLFLCLHTVALHVQVVKLDLPLVVQDVLLVDFSRGLRDSFVESVELTNLFFVSCLHYSSLSGKLFKVCLDLSDFSICLGDVFCVSLVALLEVDDVSSGVVESGIAVVEFGCVARNSNSKVCNLGLEVDSGPVVGLALIIELGAQGSMFLC